MDDEHSGDYRAICDLSGRKCWRSEMLIRWDGFLVHKDYWTPYPAYLNPLNLNENIAVTDPRPPQPSPVIDSQGNVIGYLTNPTD